MFKVFGKIYSGNRTWPKLYLDNSFHSFLEIQNLIWQTNIYFQFISSNRKIMYTIIDVDINLTYVKYRPIASASIDPFTHSRAFLKAEAGLTLWRFQDSVHKTHPNNHPLIITFLLHVVQLFGHILWGWHFHNPIIPNPVVSVSIRLILHSA
jgi:hypothetical protein